MIEKKIYKVNNIIYIEYYSYHVITVIQRCHNPVQVTKEKYDLHNASTYILKNLPVYQVDVLDNFKCTTLIFSVSLWVSI